MESSKFDSIKRSFGGHASWAYWRAPDPSKPRNFGMWDADLFDAGKNPEMLGAIHTNYVLFGLNPSRKDDEKSECLRNFHGDGRLGRDYRLRHAIYGSPLWGAYMTDVFDSVIEVDALKAMRMAGKDGKSMEDQIKAKKGELESVGANNATLIGMGNAAHSLLRKHFAEWDIVRITHYSAYITLDDYRSEVQTKFPVSGASS